MNDANKVKNTTSSDGTLSNIFISFSSRDEEFVRSLDAAFKDQGRQIWIDWKDRERSTERDQEIFARIEAADNFIFVIGAEISDASQKELSHAIHHQKRLIPAVYKDAGANFPQVLTGIKPVYFRQQDDFAASFRSLVNRIDADLKLDVFISYSRKDQSFVQSLEDAFRTAERKFWVDRKNIQHTEEWLKAIYSGIEAADNFLFIISPDSISSRNCAKELAHAVEHNKRLIPIIRRDVDSERVASALAELDWFPFRETDDFNVTFQKLLQIIDTDLDYVRAHTRLLVRAIEWDKQGRDKSLVLRGKDLREAEQWLIQAGARKPRATATQSQYIAASRQNAIRTQRIILGAITTGLVIAVGLFILAVYQYRVAETQRREAKQRLAALYEEQGRRELLQGSAVKALAYLNEAYQEGSTEPSLKFLTAQASQSLTGQIASCNGHSQPVKAIAISPDGHRIVSASDDGTARVWDASNGKQIFVLADQTGGGVRSVAFSPDGSKIVTGTMNGAATIWNAGDGTSLALLNEHETYIDSVEFSHDGKYVVTASADGTSIVWDAESGNKLFPLSDQPTSPMFQATFSPDDKLIFTATTDSTARLWDATNGKLLRSLKGHKAWIKRVAFSPDSRKVATAGFDNFASIWNAQSGKLLARLSEHKDKGHDGPVTSVVFSNDGTSVLTSSFDKTAKIWAADTGELLTTLSGHSDKLSMAAFNGRGTRAVTASHDNTVKVWDVTSGALLASLNGHTDGVNAAFFMPDDRYVVTASSDARVIVWDWTVAAAGTLPISLSHGNTVSAASFSHDGKRVLTASADGSAKIWDASNGALLASLEDKEKRWIGSAAFSPDDKRIVTFGHDVSTEIWDGLSGRHLLSLEGYETFVSCAVFDFGSTRLVTASADTTARVWDVSTGKQLVLLEGHKAKVNTADFNRDATRIVTASDDGTAKIWDAATGKLMASLESHIANITSASFSPDGSRVVTASGDRTAKLWDAVTGKEVVSLNGHVGTVKMASFSPNGSLIVTAGADNSAKIWNATTGALVASLDGHIDEVKSARFDTDGGRVVTASDDNTVKIWDAASGRLLISLQGHKEWVESAAFSPDNTQVVTASDDHTAKIWDVHFENRSKEEINALVRRHVPFRVEAGRLLPTTVSMSLFLIAAEFQLTTPLILLSL